MIISIENVFPLLATAVSDFEASEEDWREYASYFFLGDMVDFVCQRAGSGSVVEINQLSALLERLALEGDRNIQDLVLDSLEGLRGCDLRDIVAAHFGPTVSRLWASLS